MSGTISALLYLVSGVCFIMALRGLSSPETARQGNFFGMAGMVVAIGTTLALPSVLSYETIIIGILIGGAIGTVIARRSEERTSELQSLMRISYAVFCLNKKNK